MSKTLYDKIWENHLVHEQDDGTSLIYVDRHLIHEVTSPQAFEGLRLQKRKVRRPELTLAVPDHNVPTTDRSKGIDDEESRMSAPKVSLLDDPKKIVSSRLGDRLRVAGTAELAGTNKDIRQDRIRPLLGWVREYFPGVSTENYTPWAGLRPMTPDMMPLIFESRAKGIFYNTGHGHLGWTLGAATGDLLAEKMINE